MYRERVTLSLTGREQKVIGFRSDSRVEPHSVANCRERTVAGRQFRICTEACDVCTVSSCCKQLMSCISASHSC